MLKILTIHGSPHKGRTYEATTEFLQKLGDRIEIDVQHVFLFQERLESCRGCGTCVIHGENKCSIKDGFREVHAQMQAADVVIITTPVYALHITAMVKNFIDRSAYIMHRPCYFGKWFMSLSTQAITGDKDVAKYLATVMHSWGFNVLPALRLTMSQNQNVIQQKIITAVDTFMATLKHSRFPVPTIKDLMMYRVRRTIMHSKGYRDTFPRDVEYFREQGWLNSPYYYEIRLNPLMKVVGGFFDALGRKMVKRERPQDVKSVNDHENVTQVATT